jgi:hypothetical protein
MYSLIYQLKGVMTTVLRSALLTSAQLASYDHFKHALMKTYHFKDNISTHFTYVLNNSSILNTNRASMFAGVMTSLVSNPADVVRTRIMNEWNTKETAKYSRNPFVTLVQVFTDK